MYSIQPFSTSFNKVSILVDYIELNDWNFVCKIFISCVAYACEKCLNDAQPNGRQTKEATERKEKKIESL